MSSGLTSSATATSTSDASPFVSGPPRSLTSAEERLLAALLRLAPDGVELSTQLSGAQVQVMRDAGMRSLRFVGPANRRMGREAVASKAQDDDGVPLEISVNLDQNGRLFELDIWKVDFSPLLRLPEPTQITRI